MGEVKINQVPRCCSLPVSDPNYTVCFPLTQIVDGMTQPNPYYNFVTQESVWTYVIQVDADGQSITDLSHWDLAMCESLIEAAAAGNIFDFFTVEVATNGIFTEITDLDALPNGDPSITPLVTNDIPVLKIDESQPTGTTYTYRITIKDPLFFNLAAEPGIVAIKHGNFPTNPNNAQIFNSYQALTDMPLTCTGESVLLTPSLDCTEQAPPTRGAKFS